MEGIPEPWSFAQKIGSIRETLTHVPSRLFTFRHTGGRRHNDSFQLHRMARKRKSGAQRRRIAAIRRSQAAAEAAAKAAQGEGGINIEDESSDNIDKEVSYPIITISCHVYNTFKYILKRMDEGIRPSLLELGPGSHLSPLWSTIAPCLFYVPISY